MQSENPLRRNSAPELEGEIARLQQRLAALEALQEIAITLNSEIRLDRLLALLDETIDE
jgi:hypothetical protein